MSARTKPCIIGDTVSLEGTVERTLQQHNGELDKFYERMHSSSCSRGRYPVNFEPLICYRATSVYLAVSVSQC